MGTIPIDGWLCDRCGHIWPPRHVGDPAPKVCPKCKSPYWNKPYQSEAFRAAGEARRAAAKGAAVPKSPPKGASKGKKR
jgi:hypothetical protein